jgi:hypothetical protein
VAQGTTEWAALRVGIPTASNFDKIITPAKLEFSKASDGYAMRLIAEEHLGYKLDKGVASTSITRGEVLEKKALGFYRLQIEETCVSLRSAS